MIKKELLKAKKAKCFISVWTYADQDSFWCGKVVDVNDNVLTFEHYTKLALRDGVVYLNLNDIESIDLSDNYSRAMTILEKNSVVLQKISKTKLPVASGKNWKSKVLKFALENSGIPITVEFQTDIKICGTLKSVDPNFICIETFGKLGEREGKSIYRIDDIEAIQLNEMEARKRLLLGKLLKT